MAPPISSLGVDLSKRFLDCFLLPEQRRFRLPHDEAGITQLRDTQLRDRARNLLRTGARVLVVVEASGGYERLLHERLAAADVPIAIVNPKRVRAYAKGIGRLAKTDRVDAQVLARYGLTEQPRPTPLLDPARAELRDLLAYRDQILAEIAARSQQLSGYRSPVLRTRAEQEIARLRQERDALARDIAQRITQAPALAALDRRLRSVPGVGALVSAALLAYLPELGQLEAKAIVSLAGVAPFAQDSGDHRGRRTIQGGRPNVRSSLYIAALVGIRCNPILQAFYVAAVQRPGDIPRELIILREEQRPSRRAEHLPKSRGRGAPSAAAKIYRNGRPFRPSPTGFGPLWPAGAEDGVLTWRATSLARHLSKSASTLHATNRPTIRGVKMAHNTPTVAYRNALSLDLALASIWRTTR